MRLGLGEILDKASQHKNKKDKVAFLQQHSSRALIDICQYAYHPAIQWDLPEGSPPYKPCTYLDQEGMLYRELRRLYLFVNGNGSKLRPTKLEGLFIEILESIAPKDAELLLLVKERQLPKGLNRSIIEEAFPGILPDDEAEKVPQK